MEMSYHSLFSSENIHYLAIPGHLLAKAKTNEFSAEIINNEESFLDENAVINLLRANSKDFYWYLFRSIKKNKLVQRDRIKPFLCTNKLDKYVQISTENL